jgi:hypothetical protein
MNGGAHLSVPDLRASVRCPVDYLAEAEHLAKGETRLHLRNVSNMGFMAENCQEMERADRVIIRLPYVGRLEAYCMWTHEGRAGFQFERIIPHDELAEMLVEMQPKPLLRNRLRTAVAL